MIVSVLTAVLCFGFYTYTPASYQKGLEVQMQDTIIELEVIDTGIVSYEFYTNLRLDFTQENTSAYIVNLPLQYGGTTPVSDALTSRITNDIEMLKEIDYIWFSYSNIIVEFDDGPTYKPYIEFDFRFELIGLFTPTSIVNERVHYTFNDFQNLFTYDRITNFNGMNNEFYIYGNDLFDLYNIGYNDGKSEAKLTNNVFGWFGDVIDAFVNFLNLEIAPGINLGIIISIPIITGVLFFLLKALIN